MQTQPPSEKTGKVMRIVSGRGFAFVNAEDGNGDYFLHVSEYQGNFAELKEGDRIRFLPGQGDRGPRANKASLVGGGR